MAHHKFSASGSSGWLTCYGKLTSEELLPDTYSPYADQGSAAHFIGAECLINDKPPSFYEGRNVVCWQHDNGSYVEAGQCFEGQPLPDGANVSSNWVVDAEMVESLEIYTNLVKEKTGNGDLLVEQRVDFGWAIGVEGAFGTTDTVILSADGKEVTVVDLKYGFSPVEAENNSQMMLYALGTIYTFEALLGKVERVTMIICQPRINNMPKWTITIDELMAFSEEAKTAVRMCERAATSNLTQDAWVKAFLRPSYKACQWCKAKARCVALKNETLTDLLPAATDEDLEDLDAETVIDAALTRLPSIPFDDLARLYSVIDKHELFIEAIRMRMWQEMMEGEKHPEFKLVKGRAGNRTWQDPAAVEAAMKASKLREAEMYDRKIISPTVCEKLLKDRPKLWKKFDAMTFRPEGKIAIAPRGDKRPPIDPYNDNLDQLPTLENISKALEAKVGEFIEQDDSISTAEMEALI